MTQNIWIGYNVGAIGERHKGYLKKQVISLFYKENN